MNIRVLSGDSVERTRHIPHIGVVAGTADGAALCYQTLCHGARDIMGLHREPQVTLHGFPAQLYLEAIDREDWKSVADLMSESATILAEAGADLVICPNNTLHRAFDLVASPVPWLHIAEVVVAEAARKKYQRVGLLGTQVVMEGPIYLPHLREAAIDPLLPDEQERIRLQHLIRTELITGQFISRSRAFLQQVIARMAVKGADAVILACTELPLLLGDESSAVPVLDSTRLLATAALRHVMTHPKEPAASAPQRGL